MPVGVQVFATVSTLALLGCGVRSERVSTQTDPCFVVSGPLEGMVISCHPAPSVGECSFRVAPEEDADSVHVASLGKEVGTSCLDRAQALELSRKPERKTCPAGTRLVRGNCVES